MVAFKGMGYRKSVFFQIFFEQVYQFDVIINDQDFSGQSLFLFSPFYNENKRFYKLEKRFLQLGGEPIDKSTEKREYVIAFLHQPFRVPLDKVHGKTFVLLAMLFFTCVLTFPGSLNINGGGIVYVNEGEAQLWDLMCTGNMR